MEFTSLLALVVVAFLFTSNADSDSTRRWHIFRSKRTDSSQEATSKSAGTGATNPTIIASGHAAITVDRSIDLNMALRDFNLEIYQPDYQNRARPQVYIFDIIYSNPPENLQFLSKQTLKQHVDRKYVVVVVVVVTSFSFPNDDRPIVLFFKTIPHSPFFAGGLPRIIWQSFLNSRKQQKVRPKNWMENKWHKEIQTGFAFKRQALLGQHFPQRSCNWCVPF